MKKLIPLAAIILIISCTKEKDQPQIELSPLDQLVGKYKGSSVVSIDSTVDKVVNCPVFYEITKYDSVSFYLNEKGYFGEQSLYCNHVKKVDNIIKFNLYAQSVVYCGTYLSIRYWESSCSYNTKDKQLTLHTSRKDMQWEVMYDTNETATKIN